MTTLIARSDFGREDPSRLLDHRVGHGRDRPGVFVCSPGCSRASGRRPARRSRRRPRGHTLLEIAWTIAPALVLLVISVPTLHVIFRTQRAAGTGARGHRAGPPVVVGVPLPELNIATANELHLPAGRPAALSSKAPT